MSTPILQDPTSEFQPVEFYTDKDPYYYVIDNRPLRNLDANIAQLAGSLDGVSRSVLTEAVAASAEDAGLYKVGTKTLGLEAFQYSEGVFSLTPGVLFQSASINSGDSTQVLKKASYPVSTAISVPNTVTSGKERNYLIQVRLVDGGDGNPSFYDDGTNPTTAQTLFNGKLEVAAVAGSDANIGSATVPAVTSGWIPMYVVKRTFGVTDMAISSHVNAPPRATLANGTAVEGVVVEATAARTITDADAGSFITTTSSSSVTITIPAQAVTPWADSTEIFVEQLGTGQVTFVGASGVTIRVPVGSVASSAGQYSVMRLKRTGLNTWTVFGDIVRGVHNGENLVTNSAFLTSGLLYTFSSANGTLSYVDATDGSVPTPCPVTRVAVSTKLTAGTLAFSQFPLKNGSTTIRVSPSEVLDLSIWACVTGGAANSARMVVVESTPDGTFIANTRVLAYNNTVGGWQQLSGSITVSATTGLISVGMWNESSMPAGGVIYYGEPAITRRNSSIAILQTTKAPVANPRFVTGSVSISATAGQEPLPVLTSGYTSGLSGYNTVGPSGSPLTQFCAQGYSFSTANFGPAFIGARSQGTYGAHGAVSAGRSCLTLMGEGSDGTNYQPVGRIDFYADATPTSTSSPGSVQILTTPVGAVRPAIAATFASNGALAVVAGASFGGSVAITGGLTVTAPSQLGQFTLTTLPSASAFNGYIIDVTNATGGAKVCRSNGTVWQILNTTTTVS